MMMAYITIPETDLDAAASEAGCERVDILRRIEAMYRANLYEDLKWVIGDILEEGV